MRRVRHAMEISAAYCDVAVERWQRLTGTAAVLAGEGRSFDDAAAVRRRRQR